ncbi:MAG: glycosyltransferase [Bacteroidetes bacterium]|nr:glycosyltransferase [Bacteroidota bacterium]
MKGKVKVLFVVSEFYQAGAQRFTYEMDSCINKDLFELDMLCLLPLGHNPEWEDYYYNKHIELGTKVFFLDDIARPFIPTLSQRIRRKLLNAPFPHEHSALHSFLDSYDVLFFVGEYTYPILARKMTQRQKDKSLINLHNSTFQKPENYKDYDKSTIYHFVSGFKDDEIKIELTEFKDFRHTFLPLSINLSDGGRQWHFHKTDAPKIGVFTRLTYTKPLDPFIYAFHVLLDRVPNAELHIFGTGDPQKEGISKYIRHLGLKDKVKFRGHQKDLKKTAIDEKLNVVWFHGFYGIPGGFAGFDICSIGLPQLFWDFSHTAEKGMEEFPMYTNINAFAARTVDILQNEVEADKLSLAQYQYIQEMRNVKKWITNLEELFLTFRKV